MSPYNLDFQGIYFPVPNPNISDRELKKELSERVDKFLNNLNYDPRSEFLHGENYTEKDLEPRDFIAINKISRAKI